MFIPPAPLNVWLASSESSFIPSGASFATKAVVAHGIGLKDDSINTAMRFPNTVSGQDSRLRVELYEQNSCSHKNKNPKA